MFFSLCIINGVFQSQSNFNSAIVWKFNKNTIPYYENQLHEWIQSHALRPLHCTSHVSAHDGHSAIRFNVYAICLCYLDDVIVFGRNIKKHCERLETVLLRLREHNFVAYREQLARQHPVRISFIFITTNVCSKLACNLSVNGMIFGAFFLNCLKRHNSHITMRRSMCQSSL